MTPTERETLRYFGPEERLVSGEPVDWAAFDYQTIETKHQMRL